VLYQYECKLIITYILRGISGRRLGIASVAHIYSGSLVVTVEAWSYSGSLELQWKLGVTV